MQKLTSGAVLLGLSSIGIWPFAALAQSGEPSLMLKPNRCVALHQGQVCYQEVVFEWEALDAQYNYCIVELNVSRPLHCWLGGRAGRFVYDFGSDKSSRFQLQRDNGSVVAELEIVVAWVYKGRQKRNSGWRLF